MGKHKDKSKGKSKGKVFRDLTAERAARGEFTPYPAPDAEPGLQRAAAADPLPSPEPTSTPTPPATPEPTDPGIVIGRAPEVDLPAEQTAGEALGLAVAPTPDDVPRDRWDRPIIDQGVGVKGVGYRRVTTFIDVLEDKSSLDKWGKRLVLEGMALDYAMPGHTAERPSIVNRALANARAYTAEQDRLMGLERAGELTAVMAVEAKKAHDGVANALVDEASDVAGRSAKSSHGTSLHALTELVDTGADLPPNLTESDARDLRAYAALVAQAGIRFTHREQFVVHDEWQVGGTLDRGGLYRPEGAARAGRYVFDIKTGRLDYSAGKIAMQLAMYARSLAYDFITHDRTRLGLNTHVGFIIHLPAGEGVARLIRVDLDLAWRGLQLAREVYAWRKDGKAAYDLKHPVLETSGDRPEPADEAAQAAATIDAASAILEAAEDEDADRAMVLA